MVAHPYSVAALFGLLLFQTQGRATDPGELARMWWARGQEAMRQGKPDEAIRCYEQSLAADPAQSRSSLSLAAAHIEKGNPVAAEPFLSRYLHNNPNHHVVRVHHAELLLRLQRRREARIQFEKLVAAIQDEPDLAARHLLHAHSRLMEIAEGEGDGYAEHLNRGIGLYLLARERLELGEEGKGELSVEGVLCRAAAELTMAALERRGEARPSWYLYEVWTRLGQLRPAKRHLRDATESGPFSYLTPSERLRLSMTIQDSANETRR